MWKLGSALVDPYGGVDIGCQLVRSSTTEYVTVRTEIPANSDEWKPLNICMEISKLIFCNIFNLDAWKMFVLSSYLYVNCLLKSVGIVSYDDVFVVLVPMIDQSRLENVLPSCVYSPTYVVKDFPIARYQGLQFVSNSLAKHTLCVDDRMMAADVLKYAVDSSPHSSAALAQ